jgi:hypothetical protein
LEQSVVEHVVDEEPSELGAPQIVRKRQRRLSGVDEMVLAAAEKPWDACRERPHSP